MKATTGGVLRNFAKFTGKHRCQILFFNKVEDISIPPENIRKPFSDVFRVFRKACKFIKRETLTQILSCGFCKISRNTFTEHLRTTASTFQTKEGTFRFMN